MDNNYKFSKNHIWVSDMGNSVFRLGISDYAKDSLGSVMFIKLPELNENLVLGEYFGDIESIKTVSDLISPVNGEVLLINDDVLDNPEKVNDDPLKYWLLEVKVNDEISDLMDEETYKSYIETL